jgi:glycosyltransferase involved in cell wall biosynthesis
VTLADKHIFSLTVPGKIQSYLASGKPIVAAINGEGARVLHESGAGIAGPSGDSQTLAENILWLYNLSDAKRFAMGENGRHYSRREYDKIKLMDKLERILTKSAQLKYTSLFKESNHAKLQR